MTKKRQPQAPVAAPQPGYTIKRKERSRFWEVIDPAGELVCLTVYKRGAVEVVRRLCR
jgi:hypothetical protein